MRITTITPEQFVDGKVFRQMRSKRHDLHAEWIDGKCVVTDKWGTEIRCYYGGTSDNRTVYASVVNVGFIGGWQYPHRAMPFKYIVDSINRGVLYDSMNDLPKRGPKR